MGFIIGVVQDSVETALNSCGDVLFTATTELHERMKRGEKFLRQKHAYFSLLPSLKALNDNFSMKEIPSINMLLHFAPNYTVFVSSPLTIGLI